MNPIDAEDAPSLSERTAQERARRFFGQAANNMLGTVVAGVLMGAVLIVAGAHDLWLLLWFAALVLTSVVVVFFDASVHGMSLAPLTKTRRLTRWRIGLGAVSGGLCGLSVFMLPPDASNLQVLFLFCLVAGVVTLSAFSHAVVPAYGLALGLAGLVPFMVFGLSAYMVQGDAFHVLLALLAVAWLAVSLFQARHAARTAEEAIELGERLKDALEAQQRTKEQMRHMAMHDELTGLANRRYFEQVFVRTRSLAEREGSRFGVMRIDLNDFRPVNDRHGHEMGDALLQNVAGRLQNAIRASDFCARVGGDEFALIIDKVHAESDLDGMAAKLRGVLSKPFLPLGITVASGASLGWALFPADGNDMAPLLAVADKRMHAEKLAHRRAARARA